MKATAPFLALEAHGSLDRTIVARRSRGVNILSKHPSIQWKSSPARAAYTAALQRASFLWFKNPYWKSRQWKWAEIPANMRRSSSGWSTWIACIFRLGAQPARPSMDAYLDAPTLISGSFYPDPALTNSPDLASYSYAIRYGSDPFWRKAVLSYVDDDCYEIPLTLPVTEPSLGILYWKKTPISFVHHLTP